MTNPAIYGLIGFPVKHSLSAVMHNAAFKHLNINAEYHLFEIRPEDLESFLTSPNKPFRDVTGKVFSTTDIKGFNITIPYKIRARELLESISPSSAHKASDEEDLFYINFTGAVNTAKKENNLYKYRNTDVSGFWMSLQHDLGLTSEKLTNKNVTVLGCGGAGRAAIAALTWKASKVKTIYVYDINAEALRAAKLQFSQWDLLKGKIEYINEMQITEAVQNSSLLVNGSPVGMHDDGIALMDKAMFHPGLSIYDVVYNRPTRLVQEAKEKGIPVSSGLGMLLYQGADAFTFWTGHVAPLNIMQQALTGEVEKK